MGRLILDYNDLGPILNPIPEKFLVAHPRDLRHNRPPVTPKVYGRRGSRSIFAEDRLKPTLKLFDEGLRRVEFSVVPTKDGALSLFELLNALNKNPEIQKQQLDLLVHVEIPDSAVSKKTELEDISKRIADLLVEEQFVDQVTLQTTNLDLLRVTHVLHPEIKTALRWEESWVPDPEQLLNYDIKAFIPEFSKITRADVEAFREFSLPVIAWNLNMKTEWKMAIDTQIDGIITENPNALKSFLGMPLLSV
jgi:glycerophosphoryl diester phosphodiesterase